jgi:hypothetical protein
LSLIAQTLQAKAVTTWQGISFSHVLHPATTHHVIQLNRQQNNSNEYNVKQHWIGILPKFAQQTSVPSLKPLRLFLGHLKSLNSKVSPMILERISNKGEKTGASPGRWLE